jgi:hypothetical protein
MRTKTNTDIERFSDMQLNGSAELVH